MNSLWILKGPQNSQGLSDWMLNRCGRVLEVFYPCMPGEGQTLVADPEERLWRKDDNLKNVFHLKYRAEIAHRLLSESGFGNGTILRDLHVDPNFSSTDFDLWEDFACLELTIDSFKD
jgi:hypothetical protein